ncbi:hypothetical protein BH23ACT12_BH23ACT12_21900 [soil metagenome]
MSSRLAVKLRALWCLALALLMVSATPGQTLAASPLSYVALGDSYTAGPLVLPQDPDTPGCWRSLLNYPHLLRVHHKLIRAVYDSRCASIP